MVDTVRIGKEAVIILSRAIVFALVTLAILFAISILIVVLNQIFSLDIRIVQPFDYTIVDLIIGYATLFLSSVLTFSMAGYYSLAGNRLYNLIQGRMSIYPYKSENTYSKNNPVFRHYFIFYSKPFISVLILTVGGMVGFSIITSVDMGLLSQIQRLSLMIGTFFVGYSTIIRATTGSIETHRGLSNLANSVWAAIIGFTFLLISAILEIYHFYDIGVNATISLFIVVAVLLIGWKISEDFIRKVKKHE